MPNVNELLAVAIEETHQLHKGEEFIVRDLFKGYEWNRVSRGRQTVARNALLESCKYRTWPYFANGKIHIRTAEVSHDIVGVSVIFKYGDVRLKP